MVSISLDGNDYDHIIDVGFVEINRVSLPEWINDAVPDVDTNIWSLKPLKITYTMRVTHAEKWVLDQILTGHSTIKLTDAIYGITNQDVYMINIEYEYEGAINWSNPWRVTIELLKVV